MPPDLVSTQRFWAIPAAERPAAPEARRGSAESTLADQRVAPVEDVLNALATQPRANGPMPVPMAAAAPPRLPPPQPWPPASVPPPAAHGTSPPGTTRKPRLGGHMMGAAMAAAGVVIIGVGVAVLWPGDGASPVASGDGASSSSSAPAKTQRGSASPTGNASAGSAAAPTGAQPLTRGRVVSYVTAQREPGYFEGLLTLTNRTGAPLANWQVSFTYPGASIKSVWGGVLVRAGGTATIRHTAGAGSIPVGATVQVRFGAAGTPSAPVGCTLNGGPC